MSEGLDALKRRLAEPGRTAAFSEAFIKGYFGRAFGALPKSEIDLLIFSSLIGSGALTADTPLYEIARALNVTPAKAKNLLFQHQLRTVTEADLDNRIMIELTTARFGVEGRKLTFGIESPIIRSAIQARAKLKRVYTDISLSGEILAVDMAHLGAFLSAFLTASQAQRLTDRLQAENIRDADDLKKVFNRLGKEFAKAAAKEGGKRVVAEYSEETFAWLDGVFKGGDAPPPPDIAGMMG